MLILMIPAARLAFEVARVAATLSLVRKVPVLVPICKIRVSWK